MKFSAIIPAYNVDQYLPTCLDSLLCQDVDMEIIIINDGSSDKTANIAEQYKKENKISLLYIKSIVELRLPGIEGLR